MARDDNHCCLRGEKSYTHARAGGNLIFIAGTVSWDDAFQVVGEGDWNKQIETIYGDLRRVLNHFELGLGAIVRETIYTTSMDRLVAANGTRLNAYANGVPPASTWIEVERLANPKLLLEIEAIAVR